MPADPKIQAGMGSGGKVTSVLTHPDPLSEDGYESYKYHIDTYKY